MGREDLQQQFKASFEKRLGTLPLTTPKGLVLGGVTPVVFGHPTGRHKEVECWTYRRNGSPLELLFGFQKVYTKFDMIVKAKASGQEVVPDEGGSVQFNADSSYADWPNSFTLRHHGLVNVRHRVSRAVLFDAMEKATPEAVKEIGPFVDGSNWNKVIGTLDRFEPLLDNLFLYGYCVEQGKRLLKDVDLLPPLAPRCPSNSP